MLFNKTKQYNLQIVNKKKIPSIGQEKSKLQKQISYLS